jgi:hypothetical protein
VPLIRRNYLELSPERRREGAKAARERIKAALATPGLNKKQISDLRAQLDKISRWESGAAPPSKSEGQPNAAQMAREMLQKSKK